MSRGIAIFKLTGRTGGSVDKLDSIDGNTGGPGDTPLQQGDLAFVIDAVLGAVLLYELDVDSGQAENDPYVIIPDSNADDKRWKLKPGKYLGDAEADSLTILGEQSLLVGGVYGGNTPVGSMLDWSTNTAPNGWLICDGAAVSRSTYNDLFGVIGTTFGSGDGSSTFNLPDFKGKVSVVRDSEDINFNSIGKTGGAKTHTLTVSEMPAHKHTFSGHWSSVGDDNNHTLWKSGGTATTSSTGDGNPHNNLQPYLVVNKIIKY